MMLLYFLSTEETALHIFKTFNWRLRRATRLPRSLPDGYRDLCPYFILFDVKDAARDFRIFELLQAMFYAIEANEALKLDVLSRNLAENLRSALIGLRLFIFDANDLLLACRPELAALGKGLRPTNSLRKALGLMTLLIHPVTMMMSNRRL